MKFRKYLNEYKEVNETKFKEFLDSLKKEVHPKLIKTMDDTHTILERSTEGFYEVKKTRKNRKPKDTHKETHEIVDNWFEKEFGWRARSEHVLFVNCMNEMSTFNSIAFPVNPREVIWSPKITDLTIDLFFVVTGKRKPLSRKYKKEIQEIGKDKIMEVLEKADYKNTNIINFIKGFKAEEYVEGMIHCKRYYYIDFSFLSPEDRYFAYKYIGMNNYAKMVKLKWLTDKRKYYD